MMDGKLGGVSGRGSEGGKRMGMYYEWGGKDGIMSDWREMSKLGRRCLGGEV